MRAQALIIGKKLTDFTSDDGKSYRYVTFKILGENIIKKDNKVEYPINASKCYDLQVFSQKIPAVYDIEFELEPEKDGKTSMVISKMKHVKDWALTI